MNVLNKFGMLILTASLLAACGDSGNKGSSDKPAEQVAQSESSPANKYEKALSEFPEADPKLAEPIVISDKKSPDGLAELQKFIHFTTGEEAQKNYSARPRIAKTWLTKIKKKKLWSR